MTFIIQSCYFLCFLLMVFLYTAEVILAASQNYAPSFAPKDTQKFWTSSPAGNYTFGFRKVTLSSNYILAIWHSKDPNQTAIWWAEFGDNPIVTDTASLNQSINGNLELYSSPSTLEWYNSNSTANSIEFLDSGNLRLLNTRNSSGNDVAWESFEDLRDTLMLVNLTASIISNKPYLLRSRSNQSFYATGKYHMGTDDRFAINLYGIDQLGNQYRYMKDYNVTVNISYAPGVMSIGPQLSGSPYVTSRSQLEKLTLDYDGDLRVYRWSSSKNSWEEKWNLQFDPSNQCRIGNPCGPFGVCNLVGNTVNCSCPVAFHAVSAKDQSLGCSRDIPLPACGAHSDKYNITMSEDDDMDFYYNDLTWKDNLNNIEECKKLCLDDCDCIAATYSTARSCYMKANTTTNYLVNGVRRTGSSTLLMKIAVPISSKARKLNRNRTMALVLFIVVVTSIAIVSAIWFLCRRKYRYLYGWGLKINQEGSNMVGPVRFSYQELVKATKNFAHPISEHGDGIMYKGWVKGNKMGLPEGETIVAVKLLKPSMAAEGDTSIRLRQEEEQFTTEVCKFSKIHHINIVALLGYCVARRHNSIKRVLVYEYMENGSLHKYLSDGQSLPWTKRHSIAVGIARGIAYLHHDCNPPILHCDINPYNLLLDGNFIPKVAGFGIARRFEPHESHLTMSGVLGTRGYIAPEWLKTDEMTTKVDVYSFGMVLLELIHGHDIKGKDQSAFMKWALKCITENKILHSFDASVSRELTLDAANVETTTNNAQNTDPTAFETQDESHPQSKEEKEDEQEHSDSEQKLRMLRLALWCLHPSPADRPPISYVLQIVEGEHSQIGDLEEPPNPAIAYRRLPVAWEDSRDSVMSHIASYSALSGR